MLQGTGATITLPKDPQRLQAWRLALVAYRECMRAQVGDCSLKAAEAMRAACPEMTEEKARKEVTLAMTWCSDHHGAWLRRGVPRSDYEWPPDHSKLDRPYEG